MTVQRYEIHGELNGDMLPDDSGDYVLFEDYDEAMCDAQNDFDTLKRDYDELVRKLGELYRDAWEG